MKYLTKNKYWRLTEDYNIDKLLYLLIDRPIENNDITIEWKTKKNRHIENTICQRILQLPALFNGLKMINYVEKIIDQLQFGLMGGNNIFITKISSNEISS